MGNKLAKRTALTPRLALVWALLIVACTIQAPGDRDLHRWWSGFGLVVKHESFPGDCKLCHVGAQWNEISDDFEFDHLEVAGIALTGSHRHARCLRCHNDRGPVATFQSKGCAGCHEDVHFGELGQNCTSCHTDTAWHVPNARVNHLHSRLPLTGAHMQVACHRCHAGASVQNFRPTDPNCENCHYAEAVATTNPPHIGLGWTNRCNRCHTPTRWRPAVAR